MTEKLKVYGDSRSGNCYKIQLLCSELDIRYDWQEVDILAGDTHTPQFLAMNANGKIPLLALPDGRYLAESNAILCYLADDSKLAGEDRFGRAQILQWMFFEQYSHEPNIATSRFIIRYLGNPADRQADLAAKRKGGYKALDVMEKHLLNYAYFAGEAFSIADIALFAYTHVADEGGFDLSNYPAIRSWIRNIERRPAFVPMKKM
ncbi:MAG: glutathione S-transferase family protein [Gammaproteobacteria bacterium]|nr:glutathione S-transferase family protein [Gammaproteobacteria bacterium]MDH4315226.1 glutathione S-transferase family protein [Gammaproteobacteria bacterium]MDH5215006.1 glutathione S-transferase family protein [Gammaproteobacteria bacterium]MDH5501316.1 glutathione S-transferase family protein [Gammaproteobacteria bacterium]